MLKLHIANKNYSSWSLRPWVLLKTLGIPFEEHIHYFIGGYGQNPHFKAFNPAGMVPCLQDGDLTIWESLAIIEYLAESFPQVWPRDRAARAFARSAAAEMHAGFSSLRGHCSMTVGQRITLHDIPAGVHKDLARLEVLWTQGLARFGGAFLGGPDFTAVDAFFTPVAFRIQSYGLPLSPTAQAYCDRLLALHAMQDWYQAGIAETERDPDHEVEIASVGTITEDFRAG